MTEINSLLNLHISNAPQRPFLITPNLLSIAYNLGSHAQFTAFHNNMVFCSKYVQHSNGISTYIVLQVSYLMFTRIKAIEYWQ